MSSVPPRVRGKSRRTPPSAPSPPSGDGMLPHWSEVSAHETPRPRPAPTVAAVLHDLVSWAADLAIVLTRESPEDRAAIEDVRRFTYAWLEGEPCPDLRIEDVLTAVAGLLSAIDLDIDRSDLSDDDDDDDSDNDPGSMPPPRAA